VAECCWRAHPYDPETNFGIIPHTMTTKLLTHLPVTIAIAMNRGDIDNLRHLSNLKPSRRELEAAKKMLGLRVKPQPETLTSNWAGNPYLHG